MITLAGVFWPVSSAATSGSPAMECIRQVVWAEAKGETKLGQEAVAHVILNRARKSGSSICHVTRQQGQFKRQNPPRHFQVSTHGKDPTNGATYFRTKDALKWMGFRKKIKIGGHTFYGI